MVKEIERKGIPAAHITNMTAVARVIGSNRIIPGAAITNPCSDVDLSVQDQLAMRENYMKRAVKAITADIEEQTFF